MPRMGRPKVDDLREFRVNLRLSTEEKALLEAYAEKHQLKKTNLILTLATALKTQVFMKGFYELLEQDRKSGENKSPG